jgi:intein/homing endonuclease
MLKVLTDKGFMPFEGVQRKFASGRVLVILTNGKQLSCTPNHLVITERGAIEAQDLEYQDMVITTEGPSKVANIYSDPREGYVYDLLNVKGGHKYYTDGLLSHNCSFEGTGDTFIEAEILADLAEGINYDFRTEYSGRLRVWENPKPMYEYIISVDVALGKERDYSAFHIINTYNGKQVAEFYSNKTNLNEFAEIIHEKALEYNLAYVAIETNAIGYNLITYLVDILEYENVMVDEKGQFGFKTTIANREQMLVDMEEYIRMRYIRVSSERLVNELNTFIIDENNKITADINAHDDLIMSLAIGVKAFKQLTDGTPLEHNQYEIESKPPELTRNTKYLSKQYQGIDPENLKWLLQD